VLVLPLVSVVPIVLLRSVVVPVAVLLRLVGDPVVVLLRSVDVPVVPVLPVVPVVPIVLLGFGVVPVDGLRSVGDAPPPAVPPPVPCAKASPAAIASAAEAATIACLFIEVSVQKESEGDVQLARTSGNAYAYRSINAQPPISVR